MGVLSDVVEGRRIGRRSTALVVYNVFLCTLALAGAPFLALACLLRPQWRRGLGNRFGWGWPEPSLGTTTLWAHAASVGEMEGIVPLVELWRRKHPHGRVVVSSLTFTGCEVARTALPSAQVCLFPLDLPGIAPRVARRVSPDLFLFSENEIWPNVLVALSGMGVPCVQVSGRLSAFAAAALGRVRSLCGFVLGRVTSFCVQSEDDRVRLLGLGVDPARVSITGSLKADARPAPPPKFLEEFRPPGRPVVVAGSTHEGEEEVVLEAIRRVSPREPVPWWVLAPRHPQRFDAVAGLLDQAGISYVRRSSLRDRDPGGPADVAAGEVLLLDSIGELAGCFEIATVCFLGGSLVPIGGHNLLEPARFGVPIVAGPHLESVQALASRLGDAGVLRIVRSADELAQAVVDELRPGRGPEVAVAARRVVEEYGGSLARTWSCLVDMNLVERQ